MTHDEIAERIEELREAHDEFVGLQTASYLLDEGFVELDEDGKLWQLDEGEHLW